MVETNIPEGVHILDFGITMEKAAHLPSDTFKSLDLIGRSPLSALEVQDFDQKYDESGRFGYDNVKTPEGDEPARLSGPKNLTLVRLEDTHDSVSTSGDSDNISTDQGKLRLQRSCTLRLTASMQTWSVYPKDVPLSMSLAQQKFTSKRCHRTLPTRENARHLPPVMFHLPLPPHSQVFYPLQKMSKTQYKTPTMAY